MAKITFKKGSTPYTLHKLFSEGGSVTYDEAYQMKIPHLTQRIADLKKKYVAAEVKSPIMVIDELNKRGGTHTRYFYTNCNCPHETKPGTRDY